jgi:hypothetical protein
MTAVNRGGAETLRETERWFVKRGLPHFIDNYSASRDVLTRAVPALILVFLVEIVNAPKRSFPIWLDVVAVVGGFAILLGAWTIANALRHRPLLARPVDVGSFEVAVFVLAPALIPLVFGGQWRSALATAVLNLALLGLIYFGTSYGVVPMTRWAAGQMLRSFETIVTLFARALPFLVLFVTFIFLQNEAWQITSELHGPFYWLVLALFPIVGLLFAVIRLPKEIGELSDFGSWETVVERVEGTPIEPLCRATAEPLVETEPLGRRQWGNVGLVVLFSQFLQVVLVCAMVFAFLVVFGTVVVTEPVVRNFIGAGPHVLATINLWGRQMVVTEELLRVTGFLTVFSGFYFAVSVLTEDTYREEFLDEVVGEMRKALAVRAVYLAALNARPTTLPST